MIRAAILMFFLAFSACAHDPACIDMARQTRTIRNEAILHAVARTGCPKIRISRSEILIRQSGEQWAVVKLNVCGETRVYEKRRGRWLDATWRLR
jgi:hypothetical protein